MRVVVVVVVVVVCQCACNERSKKEGECVPWQRFGLGVKGAPRLAMGGGGVRTSHEINKNDVIPQSDIQWVLEPSGVVVCARLGWRLGWWCARTCECTDRRVWGLM